MTTTTIRTCDFCGGAQIQYDRERWGILMLGMVKNGAISGVQRDVCPVCIARLRQVAGAA